MVNTTVPIAAFIATLRVNGVPAATVVLLVAVASTVPVPFAPAKIVIANESFPAGAPTVSVQVRVPVVVVQSDDAVLTSNVCGVPPLSAIVTDDAFGETNCGYRAVADDPRVGIERTTVPLTIFAEAAAVVGAALCPPPQPVSNRKIARSGYARFIPVDALRVSAS